jgi:hypothetical protein
MTARRMQLDGIARDDLRDPPLSAGASADPAGLTARARPKARPDRRATNLRSSTRTITYGHTLRDAQPCRTAL